MHVTLTDVVLFLHIFIAVIAFAVAAILHVSMLQMRGATQISVLRSWARVSARAEPLFPVLVLILIGLGAWLIHLSGGEFRWSDGWVVTAVVGLVLMEAYGGIVLAPNGKKLHELVDHQPDGPVSADVHAQVMKKEVWAGAFGETGTALGILFIMPTKPIGGWAVAIVTVVGLAGALLGLRLAGARSAVAAPASAALPPDPIASGDPAPQPSGLG